MVDERITVMLSSREMLYMAAHMGMRINTLLGDPYKGYPDDAIREEVVKGRDSLEGRSLLRQIGAREWEVEGRLDSIMRFIKAPDKSLIISISRKGEESNQVLFQYKAFEVASVVFKNAYYHLSLYRDEEVLMKYLQPLLGVSQQVSQNTPAFRVPPTDLRSLIGAAWQRVEECAASLEARGFPPDEALQVAGMLAQVTVFDTLVLILRDPKEPVKQYQALLLGNGASLWWYESPGAFPDVISLQPLPAPNTIAKVRHFLHPGSDEAPVPPVQEEIIF